MKTLPTLNAEQRTPNAEGGGHIYMPFSGKRGAGHEARGHDNRWWRGKAGQQAVVAPGRFWGVSILAGGQRGIKPQLTALQRGVKGLLGSLEGGCHA